MTSERAKTILSEQIEKAKPLRLAPRGSPTFRKWYRDTSVAIEHIFDNTGRHLKDFTSVSYNVRSPSSATQEYDYVEAYQKGIDHACAVIESMVEELEKYGLDKSQNAKANPLLLLANLCNRFHLVTRQLRSRHAGRPTLDVEDEYDMQDLLHSMLHLHFDDIRSEEWTPSYAGGCSRVDFLLKQEQMVIETKKARKGLGAKEVGQELIIDISRYKTHPDCKSLVCFVYDPDGRIANPRGIENDLNHLSEDFLVSVIIAPI